MGEPNFSTHSGVFLHGYGPMSLSTTSDYHSDFCVERSEPKTAGLRTEAQFTMDCECGDEIKGHATLEGSVDRHVFEGVQCSGCERTYTVEVSRA